MPDTSTPLSDREQRLAEIRQQLKDLGLMLTDAIWLLAEVDRLAAERDNARECYRRAQDALGGALADATSAKAERDRWEALTGQATGDVIDLQRQINRLESLVTLCTCRGTPDPTCRPHGAVRELADLQDRLQGGGTQDAPAWTPTEGIPAMNDCVCVVSCADDPETSCSLSGEPHVHPDDGRGLYGRCLIHPDAPGDL